MRSFRVALAQINSTVGDLGGNTEKILNYLAAAREQGADLVAFPELAVTGYPPEDLLFNSRFVTDNIHHTHRIAEASQGITVVVGFVDRDEHHYNAAAVARDGQLVGIYRKIFLPNYGVFDEERYFRSGHECPVYVVQGVGIGVNICEDIWHEVGPTNVQKEAGAQLVININGSPYQAGKREFREQMLSSRASSNDLFLAYVNMVGGQDELVFDGASTVFDGSGELIVRGEQFREDLVFTDLRLDTLRGLGPGGPMIGGAHAEKLAAIGKPKVFHVSQELEVGTLGLLPAKPIRVLGPLEEVYTALTVGTRDYVVKNGFSRAVVGLSGGIDSALTAAIATDALGGENVIGVAMPSRYSSSGSLVDATDVAQNLGLVLHTIPIEDPFDAYLRILGPLFEGTSSGVAEENIQARIRGNILMALSNKFGWLVLTTGNKSEMATGYATLYGDMAGGFSVLKDVPKTMVYQLGHYLNERDHNLTIPRSVLTKPPSAELRPDQKDEDSLPPYETLDPILKSYIEDELGLADMMDAGFEESTIERVIGLVDGSEYKRRQAPPGIKITSRAFGRDRRFPIASRYKSR